MILETAWLSALIALCSAAVVVFVRRKNAELVERLKKLERATLSQRDHIHLASLRFGLPLPWSGWAIDPAVLLRVSSVIARAKPDLIVECGVGISTLYIADFLRRAQKGHLVALEHDPAWAMAIRAHLEREGLAEWVDIHVAPISDFRRSGVITKWYDVSSSEVLGKQPIDLLLVDGPPGFFDPLCRFPALPVFWDRLSDGAHVFLDDSNRPGERAVLELWKQEFPIEMDECRGGREFVVIRASTAVPNRSGS